MAEASVQAAAPAKGGSKLLLIVGGLVVLLLGVIAFLLLRPGAEGEVDAEPEAPMFSTDAGAILPVADTTVSLGGDTPHFAAVIYSAVLSVDADAALVEPELARLRSRAQLVFRTYDAATLDTPEGFVSLQEDLTAVAAELWPDGEVLEVLVESLLVQ